MSAITAFRLTTTDPERLARFYASIGFTIGRPRPIPRNEMALLGLEGGGTRLPLRLGGQQIDLDRFDRPGRPYPSNASAADLCFQHLALVTDDVGVAWARISALGDTRISVVGPVTLRTSSGDSTAMKFRDPDGHPMELLQVPPGSRSSWQGGGLLGIDHSAISVADAKAGRRFYKALGLAARTPALCGGLARAALDGLEEAEVAVVPLMPRKAPPHLKLLAYLTPKGRPAEPSAPNDIAATRTVWAADRDALLRDPDGHLHLLRQSADAHRQPKMPGRPSNDQPPRQS
ncbi:VOC family protein [Rhodopila sp.]|uniref:VOC family protein n=1 Tax=Rhodopila sp. TaxID=2480087 RepID=UPI003D0F9230